MKRRFLAVFFAVAMAVAVGVLATACGKKDPAPEKFTVTFDYNYDGGPEDTKVSVEKGKTVEKPSDPLRNDGYHFVQWTDVATDLKFEFSTPITSDVTLKAEWEKDTPVAPTKYAITFTETNGVVYAFEGEKPTAEEKDTEIEFQVQISPYYTAQNLIVKVNGEEATEASGLYSFTVSGAMVVTVEGVTPLDPYFAAEQDGKTEETAYVINTPAQWMYFTTMCQDGTSILTERKFKLGADLDFKGYTIPSVPAFAGTLDGQGHTIKNFVIDEEKLKDNQFYYSDSGLFGYLIGATVKNLTLENATVNFQTNSVATVGTLAGRMINASIHGVHVKNSTLSCDNSIDIDVNSGLPSYMGGVVGYAMNIGFGFTAGEVLPCEIMYCSADEVTVNGTTKLTYGGGIAGALGGDFADGVALTVTVAFCSANVTINDGYVVGGIVGEMSAYTSVTECYAIGTIIAASNFGPVVAAGGIAGSIDTRETAIVSCFSDCTLDAYAEQGGSGSGFQGVEYPVDDVAAYAERSAFVDADATQADTVIWNSQGITGTPDVKTTFGWTDRVWTFADGALPTLKAYADITTAPTLALTFTSEAFHFDTTDYDATNPCKVTAITQAVDLFGTTAYGTLKYGTVAAPVTTTKFTGFYLTDENENKMQLPAAFLFTDNTKLASKLSIGWADTNDISAAQYYYFTNENGLRCELTINTDGTAVLSDGYTQKTGNWVYFGDSICFTGISLGTGLDVRFALDTTNGSLTYSEFAAYTVEDVAGAWYASDKTASYVLKATDRTGTKTEGQTETTFEYELSGTTLTLTFGEGDSATTEEYTYNAAAKTLTGIKSTSGSLSRYDFFKGTYAGSLYSPAAITFDGMGTLKDGTKTYTYTIDPTTKKLTATHTPEGGTAETRYFAFDGYVLNEYNASNELIALYSSASWELGSYTGIYTDPSQDYTIQLGDVGANGIGFAVDSEGNEYEYFFNDHTVSQDGKTYTVQFWLDGGSYGNGVLLISTNTETHKQVAYTLGLGLEVNANGQPVFDFVADLKPDDGLRGQTFIDAHGNTVSFAFGIVTFGSLDATETTQTSYHYLGTDFAVEYTVGEGANEKNYLALLQGTTLFVQESGSSEAPIIDYAVCDPITSIYNTFVDEDGNTWEFNGLGFVDGKGIVTLTAADGKTKVEYSYTASADGAIVKNSDGTPAHTIVRNGQLYDVYQGEYTAPATTAESTTTEGETGGETGGSGTTESGSGATAQEPWTSLYGYGAMMDGIYAATGNLWQLLITGYDLEGYGFGQCSDGAMTLIPTNKANTYTIEVDDGQTTAQIGTLNTAEKTYTNTKGTYDLVLCDILFGQWNEVNLGTGKTTSNALLFDGAGLFGEMGVVQYGDSDGLYPRKMYYGNTDDDTTIIYADEDGKTAMFEIIDIFDNTSDGTNAALEAIEQCGNRAVRLYMDYAGKHLLLIATVTEGLPYLEIYNGETLEYVFQSMSFYYDFALGQGGHYLAHVSDNALDDLYWYEIKEMTDTSATLILHNFFDNKTYIAVVDWSNKEKATMTIEEYPEYWFELSSAPEAA